MDLKPNSRRALKIKPFKTQEYHIITDENSNNIDKIPTKSTNLATGTGFRNYPIKEISAEKKRHAKSSN